MPIDDLDEQVDLETWERKVFEKHGVPEGLRMSIFGQESGGGKNLTSPTGVKGRYQVTQRTAKQYGLNRDDPWEQPIAAAKYLREGYEEAKKKNPNFGDREAWLAASARYYGGPEAFDGQGNLSSKSLDGLSTPARYAEGIAKRWSDWERSSQQPAAPRPAAPSQPQATVPQTKAPKVASRGPVQPRAPQQMQGANPFSLNAPTGFQQAGQGAAQAINRISPEVRQQADATAQRMDQRRAEYNQKGFVGQRIEDIGQGLANVGQSAQQGFENLLTVTGARKGISKLSPAAGAALQQGQQAQAYTAQQMAERQKAADSMAARTTRGLTTGAAGATIMAPIAMVGGVPAVMGATGIQQDWANDPAGAAINTATAALPIAAGRMVSPVAARIAGKTATSALGQEVVRRGIEAGAGGATNVAQYAGTQALLGREIDPEEAISQGVTGGVLGTVMAPNRQQAAQMARGPMPAATRGVQTAGPGVASYRRNPVQFGQRPGGRPLQEAVAAADQIRAERMPQAPADAPGTAPLTQEMTPQQAPSARSALRLEADDAKNLMSRFEAEGNVEQAWAEADAAHRALVRLRRQMGNAKTPEDVSNLAQLDREISYADRRRKEYQAQLAPVARQQAKAAREARLMQENAPTADVPTQGIESRRPSEVLPTQRITEEIPRNSAKLSMQSDMEGQRAVQTQAGQGLTEEIPPVAGRRVRVGNEEIDLTPEQAARWAEEVEKPTQESEARYTRARQSVNAAVRNAAESRRRADAMRIAAKKREIADRLTGKEQAAADRRAPIAQPPAPRIPTGPVQEPTNRITSTDYEGGVMNRYSRPLEGAPIETPDPVTAETQPSGVSARPTKRMTVRDYAETVDMPVEDKTALDRALRNEQAENPRSYDDVTRPGEPGSGGVSFSPYNDLVSNNRAKVNQLFGMDLNSPEAQGIIADLEGFAANRNIEPRHVENLLNYIKNDQIESARRADGGDDIQPPTGPLAPDDPRLNPPTEGLTPRPKVTQEEVAPAPAQRGATETAAMPQEPLPNDSYTQARKRPDGKWQLFYLGTRNEVFPGEIFQSSSDARGYLRAMRAKRAEATSAETAASIPAGGGNTAQLRKLGYTAKEAAAMPAQERARVLAEAAMPNDQRPISATEASTLNTWLKGKKYKTGDTPDAEAMKVLRLSSRKPATGELPTRPATADLNAAKSAQVKMVITRDELQQLADLGYPKAERNRMKPDEAAQILAEGRRYQAPEPAATPRPNTSELNDMLAQDRGPQMTIEEIRAAEDAENAKLTDAELEEALYDAEERRNTGIATGASKQEMDEARGRVTALSRERSRRVAIATKIRKAAKKRGEPEPEGLIQAISKRPPRQKKAAPQGETKEAGVKNPINQDVTVLDDETLNKRIRDAERILNVPDLDPARREKVKAFRDRAILEKDKRQRQPNPEVEAITQAARERQQAASDDMRGLRPTEDDWMTPEEKQVVRDANQGRMQSVTQEAAKIRVAEKRAARQAEKAKRGAKEEGAQEAAKAKPAAEKEPWEMTRDEWNDAREKVSVQGSGLHKFTKGSSSEEVARMNRLERLLYGARSEDVAKIRAAQKGEIKLSPAELEDIQDRMDTPVRHKDVIAKALREGKPVPAEVLADYPDLMKGQAEPERASLIPDADESARLDRMNAEQEPIVRAMQGDELRSIARALGMKWTSGSDADIQTRILNSNHPDDIQEALNSMKAQAAPKPSPESPQGETVKAAPGEAKKPWQMTIDERRRAEASEQLTDARQRLADAKAGRIEVGKFSKYKSKAEAVRSIKAEVDKLESAISKKEFKGFSGDIFGDVARALRDGKDVPQEVIDSFPPHLRSQLIDNMTPEQQAKYGEPTKPQFVADAEGVKGEAETPKASPPEPETGDTVTWMPAANRASGKPAIAEVIRVDTKNQTVGVEYFGYKTIPISELSEVKKSARNQKRAEMRAQQEADAKRQEAERQEYAIKREQDWQTATMRTPEFDVIAQKEYAKAAKAIEKAKAEQAKIKAGPSGYSPASQKEYAKQQAKIDAAQAIQKNAEQYIKLPRGEAKPKFVADAEAPSAATAAKTAVTEAGKGLDSALKGLGELFGGKNKLSAGFTFDEDTYAAAKPHFQEAYTHFKGAIDSAADAGRAIVNELRSRGFGNDVLRRMKPYIDRFTKEAGGAEREQARGREIGAKLGKSIGKDILDDPEIFSDHPTRADLEKFVTERLDSDEMVERLTKLGRQQVDEAEYLRLVDLDGLWALNRKIDAIYRAAEKAGQPEDRAQIKALYREYAQGVEKILTSPDSSLTEQLAAQQVRKNILPELGDVNVSTIDEFSSKADLKDWLLPSYEDNPAIVRYMRRRVDRETLLDAALNTPSVRAAEAKARQQQRATDLRESQARRRDLADLRERVPAEDRALFDREIARIDERIATLEGQAAEANKPKLVADAEARLKDASSGKMAGSGARQFADVAIVTGYKAYKAGMKFAEWSKAVIKEAGEDVRPHLRAAWEKITSMRGRDADPAETGGRVKDVLRRVDEIQGKIEKLGDFYEEGDAQYLRGKQRLDAQANKLIAPLYKELTAQRDRVRANLDRVTESISALDDRLMDAPKEKAARLREQMKAAEGRQAQLTRIDDRIGKQIADLEERISYDESPEIARALARYDAAIRANDRKGIEQAGAEVARLEDAARAKALGLDQGFSVGRQKGERPGQVMGSLFGGLQGGAGKKTDAPKPIDNRGTKALEAEFLARGSKPLTPPAAPRPAAPGPRSTQSLDPYRVKAADLGAKPEAQAPIAARMQAADLRANAAEKAPRQRRAPQSAEEYFAEQVAKSPWKDLTDTPLTESTNKEAREALRKAADQVQRGKMPERQKERIIAAADDLMMAGRLGDQKAVRDARKALFDATRGLEDAGKIRRAGATAWDTIKKATRVTQTLAYGTDVSFAFRQAAPLSTNAANLLNTARAFKFAYDALGREAAGNRSILPGSKGAESVHETLKAHPMYDLGQKAGLELTLFGKAEEVYADNIATKLPWIKRTEAANEAFLDYMRLQEFQKYVKRIDANKDLTGIKRADAIKQAAEIVNTLTGRTDLGEGAVKRVADAMNGIMAAPRLNVSRLQLVNPVWWGKQMKSNPQVARQLAGNVVGIGATWGSLLALGAATGAFKVNLDPEDKDFGKIVSGETRYDITGGMLPVVKLVYQAGKFAGAAGEEARENTQEAAAERKRQQGKTIDRVKTYLRGRLGPLAAYASDLLIYGEDFQRRPVTARGAVTPSDPNNLALRFLPPLGAKSAYESYQKSGAAGIAKTMPAEFLGIGARIYDEDAPGRLDRKSRVMGEADSLGVDFGNLQRKKGEPDNLFKQRSDKTNEWFDSYGQKLLDSAEYKGLDAEDKKKAIRMLRSRVGSEANQVRPNVRSFEPGMILRSLREGERRQERGRAKLIYSPEPE